MSEANHTIQFMPWCHLDKSYQVGELTIVPINGYDPFEDYDVLTGYRIRTVLSSYRRNLDGHPVRNYCLVKFNDREITGLLTDEERKISRENVDLAAFSGLANRAYFNPHENQCNYDCFALYIQNFKEEPTSVALQSGWMCGTMLDGRSADNLIVTIPIHVNALYSIKLDEILLTSLVNLRSSASRDEWTRWLNSIRCFNQANTDSEHTRHQVEWVLLCSAIQHLLKAPSKKEGVAKDFKKLFVPESELKGNDSKRKTDQWKEPQQPLRFHWMKEFYNIRGDYAHGKLDSTKAFSWEPLEHLVLAKIAFPLLVKLLLKEAGHYTLSSDDTCQINIFELLANEKFFEPAPDNEEWNSSWYRYLVDQEDARDRRKRMVKAIEQVQTEQGDVDI